MNLLLKQLLTLKLVRIVLGKSRLFYFVSVRKKLRTLESKDAIDRTVKHNLKAIAGFGGARMDLLIKPISVLENIPKNARILVIGPRNEDDIFNLIGHGFQSENIKGLDLISYSKYIEIGDMHQTRFEDCYFDVLICGWTLSYSNQPSKFAQEAMRIVKDKGVIAIGVEYSTITEEQAKKLNGGYHLKTDFDRINSTKQILDLFSNNVEKVYFDHDAPNKISHGAIERNDVSNVAVIFSIKK